jgi:hypothetical protein
MRSRTHNMHALQCQVWLSMYTVVYSISLHGAASVITLASSVYYYRLCSSTLFTITTSVKQTHTRYCCNCALLAIALHLSAVLQLEIRGYAGPTSAQLEA